MRVQSHGFLVRQAAPAGKPIRCELVIILRGSVEHCGFAEPATHAELLFLSDTEAATHPPEYSEPARRIRVWYPTPHLPAVMQMLRKKKDLHCFYYEYDGTFAEGGLKNWVSP
ncbi:MAG: hypothetical protein H7A46_26380 [Verrucomicrobiales bacterium]|nr:hypothetical protein [Verrucomicrobiales bacterium]